MLLIIFSLSVESNVGNCDIFILHAPYFIFSNRQSKFIFHESIYDEYINGAFLAMLVRINCF